MFSPNGGSLNFLREVEDEMKANAGEGGRVSGGGGGFTQPPAFDSNVARRSDAVGEFFDV